MHMAKEKVDQCLSEFVWAQACKISKGLALMDSFQVSTKRRPQNNDQQNWDERNAFLSSFFLPFRMIDEGWAESKRTQESEKGKKLWACAMKKAREVV
jgi:hypothetical protein